MQVKRFTRTLAVALALGVSTTLAACASGGGSSGGDADSSSSVPRVRGNVITAANLAGHQTVSVLSAVRQLRSQWLRARGGGTPSVIVDGAPRSSLQELDNIQASEVVTITYLTPSDATQAYGTGFTDGAIVIVTK